MFVSAGAYAREIDLSIYAETLTSTAFAISHTFNKGPIGGYTWIKNIGQLESTFGVPIDSTVSASACQGWFAAREYLRRGNLLYVNRCESAATGAEYAANSLISGTNDYVATITDGATSIPATKTLTSATNFAAAGVKIGDVVQVHEGGADDGYYVIVNVVTVTITIDRNWPTGSLAAQDCTIWTSRKEGGTDGSTSVPATRQFTSLLSTFTTNGVAAGDILYISEPAGDVEDNGMYLIESVDSQTRVTVDRDFPTGSLTSLDFYIYSRISHGTDGSTAVAGEFTSATAKFADHGVQAGDVLYVNDATFTENNGYWMITGLKAGATDVTLEVNAPAWPGGVLGTLDYEVWPGSITMQGATKGTWCAGLRLYPQPNASDPNYFDLEVKDSTGSIRQEKVFNMNLSTVVAEMASNSDLFTAVVRSDRLEPVTGGYTSVSGGDDGYTGIVDADYIGSTTGASGAGTGLRTFLNPEKVDINLIACPGSSSQNVQDELINIAEKRADCFALIDPADWATLDSVADILAFQNGTLSRTTALNSSFAGMWWTWQQVYDEFHDDDVWTAPSGHIAAMMAYNDNVQAPWFAPAGLRRGKLIGSKDLRYSPDQDDREAICPVASTTGRINPIVEFTGEGIYAFGQKTLTTVNSALNRINVRRMLLYAEKVIATAARILIFEPNDAVLDREFLQLVTPVLDNILSRRGIREYRIVSATTDADRDNNKAVYKLFIKPTKAAEVIEIQFILTSQGADFSELIAAA